MFLVMCAGFTERGIWFAICLMEILALLAEALLIKLRGFRIELKEIETVLAKHTNVLDVVVVVLQNGS